MEQKANKKKRKIRWWRLSLVMLGLVVIVVAILFIMVEAGSLHAEKYSPELVKKAKGYYDLAITNWTAQNKEWFFQRDFSRTRNFANLSEKAAKDAISEAIAHEANLNESLSGNIASLKT